MLRWRGKPRDVIEVDLSRYRHAADPQAGDEGKLLGGRLLELDDRITLPVIDTPLEASGLSNALIVGSANAAARSARRFCGANIASALMAPVSSGPRGPARDRDKASLFSWLKSGSRIRLQGRADSSLEVPADPNKMDVLRAFREVGRRAAVGARDVRGSLSAALSSTGEASFPLPGR